MLTNVRGLLYDPKQTGSGFELRVDETGRHFSEFFCGRVPNLFDQSTWFSIQGIPDEDGSLPLLLTTGTVLGQVKPLKLKVVGSVKFDAIDADHIRAIVTVSGNSYDPFSPVPPPVTTTYTLEYQYRF